VSAAELEAVEIQLEQPSGGLWYEAWYRLRHNPGAIVGAVLVSVFVICAIGAPVIAPHDPAKDTFLVNGILQPQPRAATTGSASTSRAATSSAGSSTARATRC
jgi:ABC-type dipeptide/oligopeptide/nickel transport system permease subunit